MSTARANLSVGPPYDLAVLRTEAGVALEEFRVAEGSPLLERLRAAWEAHMLRVVAELPPISAGDLEAVVGTDPPQ
jgi:putative proteasome-type protease